MMCLMKLLAGVLFRFNAYHFDWAIENENVNSKNYYRKFACSMIDILCASTGK